MSEYEAEKYLDFAKCIAEKEDCIGLNNHYLDIQQKVFNNGNRINEKLKKSNTQIQANNANSNAHGQIR